MSRIYFHQACISLLAFCFCSIEAIAESAGIYRTSNQKLYSHSLGSDTVAALVVHDNKRQNGLFLATVPANSLARTLGLPAGSVLLTLDGYGIASVEAADRWMRQRPQRPLDFTYAVMKGGKPVILSGRNEMLDSNAPGRPAAAASGAASAEQNSNNTFSTDNLERHLITLINASRSQNGLASVSADSSLSRLARSYADYMLAHPQRYVHPSMSPHMDLEGRMPMQRARQAGINMEVHENLGRESRTLGNDQFLVEKQHKMMMAEPPGQHNHRAIILDPDARSVGVGIARDGVNLYLVEEFGH